VLCFIIINIMAYRIYKHYDGWSFSVNHATAGMKWVHYV